MKARGETSPRGVELMVHSPHCSRAACGLGATFCFKSFISDSHSAFEMETGIQSVKFVGLFYKVRA